MGIARDQFTEILQNIFKAGNKIALYKTVPRESDEGGGVEMSGVGYQRYTILNGDFSVSGGEVTSLQNMMLYLSESDAGNAEGFGVYNGSKMLYFGKFTDADGNPKALPVGYNTVPTIKKYDKTKNEGVHITLTSTNVSATAE